MSDFVTVQRISSAIGKKSLESLSLFFQQRRRFGPDGEWLSSGVADQSGDSATFGVRQKSNRIRAIRRLQLLPRGICARGRDEFPCAHDCVLIYIHAAKCKIQLITPTCI